MASSPPPPPPPPPRSAGDRRAPDQAERLARLERLAQRRADADRSTTAGRAPTSTANARPAGEAPRARRRHPARGARAAALGLSLMSTAGLAALFALTSRSDTPVSAAAIVSGPSSTTAPPPVGGSSAAPASSSSTIGAGDSASAPATATAATVVDGGVSRTKWGPVQVEATFAADGTLADVAALQTPNDRTKSVQINQLAVPRLTQEALSAQTADVQTISGATYTSNGYRQSLQSAIDAARAAGLTAIA